MGYLILQYLAVPQKQGHSIPQEQRHNTLQLAAISCRQGISKMLEIGGRFSMRANKHRS